MQYSVTQHNTIQRNTTQQRSATQNNATQRNTAQYSTAQRNTTQRNTTQHNTTQRNATQRSAAQHNTTQHNTTQHNTTQHNTSLFSYRSPFEPKFSRLSVTPSTSLQNNKGKDSSPQIQEHRIECFKQKMTKSLVYKLAYHHSPYPWISGRTKTTLWRKTIEGKFNQ